MRINTSPSLLPWPNPTWKENPYQKLLYQAMRPQGISIRWTFPRFSTLHVLGKADWLHLNWPETLYAAREPARRMIQQQKTFSILERLKIRGTRLLWTVHNEYPHEAEDMAFYETANRRLGELSDLIHVHFPAARQRFIERYRADPDKILVMPHGHYENYYGPALPKREARQILGLPEHGRVALYFGLLRQYKGVDRALEAFLASGNPNLYFLIAGKPVDDQTAGYLQKAQRRSGRLLLRLGHVENATVAPLFSAADVFVYPSSEFFTSGSIMLAVTYRLPFIAIAHNHTLLFQNRSFFMPLDPEDPACLTGIFDGLEDRLSGVEPRDFDEITETCRWSNLTPPLCQKLKECP